MRDFNWLDIPFGFFFAGVLMGLSMAIAGTIVFVILGYSSAEGMGIVIWAAPVMLIVGMIVLFRLYPGPGRMIERPLLAVAAFLALPLLSSSIAVLGVFGEVTDRYSALVFGLAVGLFPSLVIGFVVLFAIVSEARKTFYPQKTNWPLIRPTGSQGGTHGMLTGEAKVFAGLERAGPEEERPDTFVRMKTKE